MLGVTSALQYCNPVQECICSFTLSLFHSYLDSLCGSCAPPENLILECQAMRQHALFGNVNGAWSFPRSRLQLYEYYLRPIQCKYVCYKLNLRIVTLSINVYSLCVLIGWQPPVHTGFSIANSLSGSHFVTSRIHVHINANALPIIFSIVP